MKLDKEKRKKLNSDAGSGSSFDKWLFHSEKRAEETCRHWLLELDKKKSGAPRHRSLIRLACSLAGLGPSQGSQGSQRNKRLRDVAGQRKAEEAEQ